MTIDHGEQARLGIDIGLDHLASFEAVGSNCMFQLALMLARIAVEPCPDSYKEQAAQAIMAVIRDKPKDNVVRLFGAASKATPGLSGLNAA